MGSIPIRATVKERSGTERNAEKNGSCPSSPAVNRVAENSEVAPRGSIPSRPTDLLKTEHFFLKQNLMQTSWDSGSPHKAALFGSIPKSATYFLNTEM